MKYSIYDKKTLRDFILLRSFCVEYIIVSNIKKENIVKMQLRILCVLFGKFRTNCLYVYYNFLEIKYYIFLKDKWRG